MWATITYNSESFRIIRNVMWCVVFAEANLCMHIAYERYYRLLHDGWYANAYNTNVAIQSHWLIQIIAIKKWICKSFRHNILYEIMFNILAFTVQSHHQSNGHNVLRSSSSRLPLSARMLSKSKYIQHNNPLSISYISETQLRIFYSQLTDSQKIRSTSKANPSTRTACTKSHWTSCIKSTRRK